MSIPLLPVLKPVLKPVLCSVVGHDWKDETITEGIKRLRCARCSELGYPVPNGMERPDSNLSGANGTTEAEVSQDGQESRAPDGRGIQP